MQVLMHQQGSPKIAIATLSGFKCFKE